MTNRNAPKGITTIIVIIRWIYGGFQLNYNQQGNKTLKFPLFTWFPNENIRGIVVRSRFKAD